MRGDCEHFIGDCSCAIDPNAIPEHDCYACKGQYMGLGKCHCGEKIIRDTNNWWICPECGPVDRLSPSGGS